MSIQEQNTTRLSNQNTLHNSPKKAPDSTPQHDAKMRRSLFAARAGFFTGGFTVASWAPIIPFVQTELSLEPAVLGTLLFGLGIGSFFGMPIAGTVSTRFGNRAALAASGVLSCLLLVVLAMIPGKNTNEYVIMGAHFDHVGCDPDLEGDSIYNGADDNASGVSAALQIAHAFATAGVQPERNIIFAFWDGEEIGLLGSRFFMQTCAFADKIKGYLNFDMIGRNNKPENPPYVVYFYTAAHPVFGDWLKNDIKQYNLHLDPDYRAWDKPVGGSDNGTFAKRDIPVIWYHTDGHPDYHMPGDEAQKINYEKVTDISRAAFLNLWNLANEKSY